MAILARGEAPREVRRALPGDRDDVHSRYLEATVRGNLVCCLYLPNGNPQPGPKFDYKLAWFERLIRHAGKLWKSGAPVVLAGDFNVVPTDFDIYDPTHWKRDALLQPQSRARYERLLDQGWTDSLRKLHPDERIYTFWDYFRNHWARNAGLRIDHILLSRTLAPRLVEAGVDRWVRDQQKASDHAPAWVILETGTRQRKSMKSAAPSAKRAKSGPASLGIPAPGPVKGAPAARDAATLPGAVRRRPPPALRPALAVLVDAPPARPEEWTYEVKFDGYRILAQITENGPRLITRNGKDWTERLPHLVQSLQRLKLRPGWLDGEIVVLNAAGAPSFQALQNAFDAAKTAEVRYFLFDVPYYDGFDLTKAALADRRALLRSLLKKAIAPIAFSEAFESDPAELLESACKLGLEGIIGKRKASGYQPRRTSDWIKLKCGQRQEFVIGGWTDPKGGRVAFGALLLGVHDAEGRLVYAGKVGTGFDDRSLAGIAAKLRPLACAGSPFHGPVGERGAHWVRPELSAEVSFSEWTNDGHLRHPVFHALRTDKAVRAIVREKPRQPAATARRRSPATGKVQGDASAIPAPVRVTHPDRVVDGTTGAKKIDVVNYYARIGQLMMEHVADRPVSLLRAPRGIGQQTFFQKHVEKAGMPGVVQLDQSVDPEHPRWIAIGEPLGLVAAAQMNVIEFHTWNATKDDIVRPDRITFDLDPGEHVKWPAVLQAAELMQGILGELKLAAFVKTSGGKGLHVVTPIRRQYDWDTVKRLSQLLVGHMAKVVPQLFVAKSGPKNRVGRIFIDYLRNGFGATTVSAWSLRARPGLGVSVPFGWEELRKIKGGAQWTLKNVGPRLATGNASWKEYRASAASIAEAMKKLGMPAGKGI